MRGRWLLNIALLVAVAVLGWLALADNDDQQLQLTPLSPVDPLTITTMRIEHDQQPLIELEKIDTQWHMQTPYDTQANNTHINKLLSVLETPTHAQFNADRDLKQFGLDKPKVHMTMNTDLRISFGDVEPIGKRRYVRLNDTIHVIGDSPFSQLTAAASLLVDTSLLANDAVIKSISAPGFDLQQLENGSWQVSPAGEYSADKLNSFVDEWKHARAVFVSDPEKPSAGEQSISIKLSDESSLRFGIVNLNTGLTVVNHQTGLHYHFAADVGEKLLNLPDPDA